MTDGSTGSEGRQVGQGGAERSGKAPPRGWHLSGHLSQLGCEGQRTSIY